MMEILPINHPRAFNRALKLLEEEKLVVIPTDTVYGIVASPFSRLALERIFEIKEKPSDKAVAILIGEYEQIDLISKGLNKITARLAERFWPGLLTMVIHHSENLPENISQNRTIGVRMPDHEFARSLLRKFGPLAVTSASLSGHPNPINIFEVLQQLADQVDLVLDGSNTPGNLTSTVVDCTTDTPQILREGGTPVSEIIKIVSQFSGSSTL